MGKIADYIAAQMGQGQVAQGQGAQVQASRQEMAQGAGPQQGAEVDPLIDTVARKLAVLEGSPEEKYAIFVQLFPMLMNAMAERAVQGGQVAPDGGYDVSGSLNMDKMVR